MANFKVILVTSLMSCFISAIQRIPIKIVEEPMNYEFGNLDHGADPAPAEDVFFHKTNPADISGPHQFRRLAGKCFNWASDKYKFVFCPFHNITQHELSASWNPYRGILGIWGEWNIVNNHFVEMMMLEGDPCGDTSRSAKVSFQCSSVHQVLNVTEPKRCQYQLAFASPLVCHNHSMLVYPRLSRELQKQWDELATDFYYGYVTEKGLAAGLRRIYLEAGFLLTEQQRHTLRIEVTNKNSKYVNQKQEFSNIFQCEQEHLKLERELAQLREQLALKDKELRDLRLGPGKEKVVVR